MLFFVLLLGMSLGFGMAYYWLKRESRSLNQQIQALLKEPYSIRRLTLDHGNLALAPLVMDWNHLLDLYQEELALDRQQARDLRGQLASLSHDLRTPLTAISGYLELLDQDDLTPEDRAYYLAIVQERTQFLYHLIESIFFLSKLEMGRVNFHLEPVYLSQRLEEALAAFFRQITAQGLTLQVNVESGRSVVSDLASVDRIYANLITNFIHHGHGQVIIQHQEEGGQVITRIQNQLRAGENLSIERIFDKHYTGSSERNYKNSGLGLAIVKDLCQQLGHQVNAKIEADCFIIEVIW
ncbi:sensor histidine kinase [Hutsoniella sourekii]